MVKQSEAHKAARQIIKDHKKNLVAMQDLSLATILIGNKQLTKEEILSLIVGQEAIIKAKIALMEQKKAALSAEAAEGYAESSAEAAENSAG